MIVVTGATGQLGRLVIDALLKRVPAEHIVAAVRNVEKAQPLAELGVHVRQANYDDPDSWQAALQGAEKVLLISSSEIGQRVNQHRAVIEAAKRQGVALLAYTSLLHADSSPLGLAQEHRETEALIHASGVPYVLLRNGWYTENYTQELLGRSPRVPCLAVPTRGGLPRLGGLITPKQRPSCWPAISTGSPCMSWLVTARIRWASWQPLSRGKAGSASITST